MLGASSAASQPSRKSAPKSRAHRRRQRERQPQREEERGHSVEHRPARRVVARVWLPLPVEHHDVAQQVALDRLQLRQPFERIVGEQEDLLGALEEVVRLLDRVAPERHQRQRGDQGDEDQARPGATEEGAPVARDQHERRARQHR